MDETFKCPGCGNKTLISFFDTRWRMPDKKERILLAIMGTLCVKCPQLYLDPEILKKETLINAVCISAIETDIIAFPNYLKWKNNNPKPGQNRKL